MVKRKQRIPYSEKDLELIDDSESEQLRTRKIFEDLVNLSKSELNMLEREKSFIYFGYKNSRIDEDLSDHIPECDNPKFKELYLTYFQALSGGRRYFKARRGEVVEVSQSEVNRDLTYLSEKSEHWERKILDTRHSEKLLKYIAQEGRKKLKDYEGWCQPRRENWTLGYREYLLGRRRIVLQNKYIYHIGQEIFESLGVSEVVLNLGDSQIIYNAFSLVHILTRHFAKITNPFDDGKSYHSMTFHPRFLHRDLQQIFDQIPIENVPSDPSQIPFRYNGINYIIWTKYVTEGIKGQGNVKYLRLQTFYPIEQEPDISRVAGLSEVVVNENLTILIRN
ncbi:MAG: hypothetical protein JJ975_12760 [Bacteroidia bacterium]|nr:hypothetical protein [Bacteroidia bacterium]